MDLWSLGNNDARGDLIADEVDNANYLMINTNDNSRGNINSKYDNPTPMTTQQRRRNKNNNNNNSNSDENNNDLENGDIRFAIK